MALKSIWYDQSLKPNQIVIVKDGPIDNDLNNIIEAWKSKISDVIKIVSIKRNQGLGKALNIGLRYCDYDLIARMDADDISLKNRFEKQIEYFKTYKNIDILGSWGYIIDSDGNVIGNRKQPKNNNNIKRILWACPIIHVSVMFKRNSIIEVGSYDSKAGWRQEDYELWIRSGLKGLTFGNIQEYLIKYRVNINKNNINVGYNRFKLGLKAVNKFDGRLYSYLAVLYPLIRSILPNVISNKFEQYLTNSNYDPRRRETLI